MAIRLIVLFPSIVAALLLQGCVTNATREAQSRAVVAAQWTELDRIEACCAQIEGMDFPEFEGDYLTLALESTKARRFETGKSYFGSAQLSSLRGQSILAVKANFSSLSWDHHPSVVRPSFLVLDEKRSVIATHVNIPICFVSAWDQKGTGFFGLLEIDPQRAWGIVVFTAESTRGSFVQLKSEATVAGGGAIVETKGVTHYPAGPTGKLEVRALDDALRKRLENRCPELFK